MNSNSFTLKGWCVTLVSALFALAAKDVNQLYVLVAYIPIPAFWLLDGYYLSQERQYRDLYKQATACDPANVDFSLDARQFNKGRNTWPASLVSSTIAIFYGVAAVTVLVVMFMIQG
jgi:hypothetical protein